MPPIVQDGTHPLLKNFLSKVEFQEKFILILLSQSDTGSGNFLREKKTMVKHFLMDKTNTKLLIFLLRKINVNISEHFKTIG